MTEPDDGLTTGPADVGAEVEALRQRAADAERQRDDYLNLLRRNQAEFENYQKRAVRDQQQERRYWNAPLVLDLLPALDNLERATAAARQAGEAGPLVQGVAMVQAQLLEALKRHGIQRIDALGRPFDPNQHEAVMQRPVADQPPGTVVEVLGAGYLLHDRVLRPASVVVSTAVE
jgi:molecular chaperone GrpE